MSPRSFAPESMPVSNAASPISSVIPICRDGHLRLVTCKASQSRDLNSLTNLFESLRAKGYVDTTYFQERRRDFLLCGIFLVLSELLSLVIKDLGGAGNQGHKLGELCTEVMDVGIIDSEKITCFGFLRKTSRPVNNKPRRDYDRRI